MVFPQSNHVKEEGRKRILVLSVLLLPFWSAPFPIDGVPETDRLPQVHRQEGGLPGGHASTG